MRLCPFNEPDVLLLVLQGTKGSVVQIPIVVLLGDMGSILTKHIPV